MHSNDLYLALRARTGQILLAIFPVRHWCLACAVALAGCILAFILPGGRGMQVEWRTVTYCALALPPSQVARRVQLEAVYCRGLAADRQCLADVGWIVVSEPVPCD